jgi:signal transduction histidine kinase
MSDASRESWTPAGLPIDLPRDLLKRYGLALALGFVALLARAVLPVPEGTAIYQVPLAAVILSAWFWFVPPAGWKMPTDHLVGFSTFIALCLFLVEFGAGRRRIERALEDSEPRASRVMTTGQLTTSIAHEVNQPLGAMVANAAACVCWLAAEPAETGKARRALERIVDDGQRASQVIASRLDGAQAVLVEVRDSGPGLALEHADRLFEAFYTTKPEGLGIGLSISRSIIEAHGGQLSAAQNAPHGAIFRFTLPVQEGAKA